MKIITLEQLKESGACHGQIKAFLSRFGKSVEVTEELCVEHAQVFDWEWAAGYLLKDKTALNEFIEEEDKANEKLDRVVRKAYDVYQIAACEEIGISIHSEAMKAYSKARVEGFRELNETLARAFARAYTKEHA